MLGLAPIRLPLGQVPSLELQSSVSPSYPRSLLHSSSPPFIWNPADPSRREIYWDWLHFFTAVPVQVRKDTIRDTIMHMTSVLPEFESQALQSLPSYHTLYTGLPNWAVGLHPRRGEKIFSGESPGYFKHLIRSAWASTHRPVIAHSVLNIRQLCPSLKILNCFTLQCSDSWYWTVDLTSSPSDVIFAFPAESPIRDSSVDTSVHCVPIVVGSLLDEVLSTRRRMHSTLREIM